MRAKKLFWPAVLFGFGSLAIVHTASGQSWTPQYTVPSESHAGIFCVKAVDESTVWAGAGRGVYLRATDGGQNWTSGLVPGAELEDFYSIAAIDQNTAYFVSSHAAFPAPDARIYKTTNGGQNWTLQYQNTEPGAYFNSIAFWDKDNGIAFSDPVGGSFLIVTTSNGGATWERIPAANIPPPFPNEYGGFSDGGGTALAVEGTSNAWFGTSLGEPVRVFRTTDKGRTWTVANTPLATTRPFWGIATIAFKDSLNGFAGGGSDFTLGTANNLIQTTDGGRTWTVVTSYAHRGLSTLVYVPNMNNLGLCATAKDGSIFSPDGGATWNRIDQDSSYSALTFVSPTVGWAAGWASGTSMIVKFNGNLATAVAERPTNKQPQGFDLAQNYPNPFNPETRIKFQLPSVSWVRLEVINLMGQHVATLLEGKRPAGEYEITWDGRNDFGQSVSSGIYLLKMQAGKFSQTRKMVLTR